MAFKAVYLYRLVAMAADTEAILSSNHAVVLQAGMAFDAILQALRLFAYALVYCFIALVQKYMHVVLAHPLRVFYTLPPFAYVELGHAVVFRGARRCNATESHQCGNKF